MKGCASPNMEIQAFDYDLREQFRMPHVSRFEVLVGIAKESNMQGEIS
jgi:hypothetical protein